MTEVIQSVEPQDQAVTKKPRKQRTDKGKTRAPYKKKVKA